MSADRPACDPARCPLCGQPNACMRAAGDESATCWCVSVRFAPQTLARIPPACIDLACICPQCADAEPAQPSRRA
ncbi:MAG TPA: cysteine-rich CWC family protein [Thiomonas arsenitoxydans]|uniref:cysteine-rich CWC family protein n=1 Tax=Thiomonas TaxID=32012 RepID=UPI002580E233|nr:MULTISPECIES: cysteine-rich CWC family protein [Thiomonas]HML81082.1 cysteine-rich CWC family protein [Thiomonas arsenitoxydans]